MNIIITESQYKLIKNNQLNEGILNTIADVVGIYDPTGIVDLGNAISYWRQDKNTFAILSLISAIPGTDFITKPFIIGGKIIGGISQTKILGWLVRTFDKWIGKVLDMLDKMAFSKIPIIKNFANGLRTFILSLKKDSGMKLSESKIQKILIEHNFNQIYNDLYNKMFKTICLKYSKGDYEKAQDFCQNGFIKAYEKLNQFRGENVSGWVSMVIRNHILDELRKEKRNMQVKDFDFSKYDPKDEEYDDLFMGQYSEDDIKNAIEKLSPMYKKTLELYYFEDLTHDEIAKRLGISSGTSKSNLFKAKEKMKKFLGG